MKPRRLALLLLALPMAALATPKSGIDFQHFDPKVRIQDDLFMAVNGGWLNTVEIPADRSGWGAGYELSELSQKRVREVIESASQAADSLEAKQIAALYQSFMDEAQAEKLGISPLKPLLDEVAAVQDSKGLLKLFGALRVHGVSGPLLIDLNFDHKDSTRYLAEISQSGLGLPDRDYYLKKDPRFTEAKQAYASYLTTLFNAAGLTDPTKRAEAVIALEQKLAAAQWDNVALRDPNKNYNKLDRKGLAKVAPKLDWATLLAAAEMADIKQVNLAQPSYAKALSTLLSNESLAVWQDYARARIIDDYASLLNKELADANFSFHGKALAGQREQKPRWKRGVAFVESHLGEAVGKRYVAAYFPAEAKTKMEQLVGNLLKAYEQSIDGIGWMSAATKAAGHEKLSKYMVKIGYPNQWRDYSALAVKADDVVGNAMRSAAFQYRYNVARLNKPVDRNEWFMTPQTVNAYYNPSLNEIVFPAAFLQPPMYRFDADDAVNYGAIGSVIGHEISHGFDDSGSQYDGNGNLRNWWQKSDAQAFNKLTSRLVSQYDNYEPLPGKKINGKLTLGENIADLSGLQIAFKAYQISLGGKPSEVIDGYTGEQRFYIGFGQAWRTKRRDALTLQILTSDPHSPDRFRPIGAAVNTDSFHTAFSTKPGDGMWKADGERIKIW